MSFLPAFSALSSWPQQRLQAQLAGDGLVLAIAPWVVRLRSPIPIVAQGLARLYAGHGAAPAQAVPFCDFHVAVQPRRHGWRRLCAFELDGHQPFTPLARGEAFALWEWGLNWCITSHCHQWLTLHAAVLERGGRALILPAPPGAGKSTLCAALMLHGWRLLSDELTLLDPASGQVQPAPRPISLKNASIALIQERAPDGVFGPVAHNTQKGTVAHFKPCVQSLALAQQPALPAWVVFPQYAPGAALTVTPQPKASAVLELARHSFNQHVHGRDGFHALVQLADRCACFGLRYSQLDQALAWFDSLEPPP